MCFQDHPSPAKTAWTTSWCDAANLAKLSIQRSQLRWHAKHAVHSNSILVSASRPSRRQAQESSSPGRRTVAFAALLPRYAVLRHARINRVPASSARCVGSRRPPINTLGI
ncbi:uncharacterized protein CC84DRAFT_1160842 [Paraphaeosphaeria sporulosa]|uniref:Uncharacterized protein n=1 Tax=Paraphaeosphaeria sporulosa TaxID=1460663 RepID=A0A177CR22_9PLEO|nr:uncharacterized protein CC84DRAFT_1160842 [Paraphaeosphaeria sporulosa]OAG09756.1 hypothetical protein CC84DRAFT_1160842 [Paraphaeosphaeria sporulosa]